MNLGAKQCQRALAYLKSIICMSCICLDKDYFHAYAFHIQSSIHIVRYELHMLSDGSTFIERIEGLEEEEATTSKQK